MRRGFRLYRKFSSKEGNPDAAVKRGTRGFDSRWFIERAEVVENPVRLLEQLTSSCEVSGSLSQCGARHYGSREVVTCADALRSPLRPRHKTRQKRGLPGRGIPPSTSTRYPRSEGSSYAGSVRVRPGLGIALRCDRLRRDSPRRARGLKLQCGYRRLELWSHATASRRSAMPASISPALICA